MFNHPHCRSIIMVLIDRSIFTCFFTIWFKKTTYWAGIIKWVANKGAVWRRQGGAAAPQQHGCGGQ
jgi:hypothetical protein